MASINAGRVVVGGLLAGVVMNACDMFWNFVVLKDDMLAVAQRLGMDAAAAQSFAAGVPWIVVDFVIGLAVVWNYAAIRPRFGPGATTALLAALAPWVVVNAVVFGFSTMGLMSMAVLVRGVVTSAISVGIGAVVGAWAYKEESAAAAVGSRVSA